MMKIPSIILVSILLGGNFATAAGKSDDTKGESKAANAGLPTAPGAYKKLPCVKNGKLTFDLYLPKNYTPAPADKTDRGYPAVFLSSPHKNPGFQGLEKWADKNGVILVTFNDSENGPTDAIILVQDAVLQSITALRIHPSLRFAGGFSGAAAASMVLAARKPKEFAGVVMHCHSLPLKLPKTTSIAYLARFKDEYQGFIGFVSSADEERLAGLYVIEEFLPGAHGWFPSDHFARALDAELLYAKLVNPQLTADEKTVYAKNVDTLLAGIRDRPPGEVVAAIAPLAHAEALKSRPFRARAVEVWSLARVAMIEAEPSARKRFEMFVDHATAETFAECRGEALKAATDLRKKLESDASLKAEFEQWKDWLRLRQQYVRMSSGKFDTKKYEAVKKGLVDLAKKAKGTYAGDLAAYSSSEEKKK